MVYGQTAAKMTRLNEKSKTRPVSPYGKSKLAAERVVTSFTSPLFHTTIVRPFNHTGPGQSPELVCPAFAWRIVKAKPGSKIPVGDLRGRRDFTDVRDVVRAYRLIVEKQPKDPLFVIGSGRAVPISFILKTLLKISKKSVRAVTDPNLLQRADLRILIADPKLIRKRLGWKAQIPLQTTLRDIYREALSKSRSAR